MLDGDEGGEGDGAARRDYFRYPARMQIVQLALATVTTIADIHGAGSLLVVAIASESKASCNKIAKRYFNKESEHANSQSSSQLSVLTLDRIETVTKKSACSGARRVLLMGMRLC